MNHVAASRAERFDNWLAGRRAAQLFFVSVILLLLTTPDFFGYIDATKLPRLQGLLWNVLQAVPSPGIFFLWFGMWRYWVRVDQSERWKKRVWFAILPCW